MLNIEKFILCIRDRPALYDVGSDEYKHKAKKEKYWQEVGEAMYEDWHSISASERDERVRNNLMKKWKALRDNFVRECRWRSKPGTKKRKYIFYDLMEFLIPHVKPGEKNGCGRSEEQTEALSLWEDLANDLVNGEITIDGSSAAQTLKRKERVKREPVQPIATVQINTPETQDNAPSQREECNSDKYGNKAFLLSYLPVMDALPQQAQLHARMLITQIFFDLQTQPDASACESD